jgi:hypothetical protein
MKPWLQTTAAVVAFAACAVTASAQTTTASPPPDRFQAMRQMHRQMTQIGTQARTQMLAALTPAHRTLLANVAGQLAVATTPDFRAAAQQLDTALSAPEKQAILAAETNARSQMRTAFAQMQQQMPSRPGAPGPSASRSPRPQASAGAVLLRHAFMSPRGGQRRM